MAQSTRLAGYENGHPVIMHNDAYFPKGGSAPTKDTSLLPEEVAAFKSLAAMAPKLIALVERPSTTPVPKTDEELAAEALKTKDVEEEAARTRKLFPGEQSREELEKRHTDAADDESFEDRQHRLSGEIWKQRPATPVTRNDTLDDDESFEDRSHRLAGEAWRHP